MTTTALDDAAAVGRNDDFRQRLLDGLAASIDERGYRDTTVADIVRYARTSKRTFYSQFGTKEDCFAELLTANNDELVATIRDAVDAAAPWYEQVRQAVVAYVHTIEERPAITLSWIRELPALGEYARPILRRGFGRLATMIVELTTNEGFRSAGLAPLSRAAAVILVGGLRELTAQTVEDGRPVTDIIEPALAVSLALLGPKTLI
ncbi:TetR/AcrR family transcriptional regulator [Mycolicibacterium sarraceniae]|uniref:TetR family transcriptional regulator n=1 Tax=Mycolicibacterium sarraceniae TaxID=1534348 RepID=A0A7I7SPC9_9MYCO|nr:TetR/AcrR family transcriptional regulator [Mycolicibacterium sarraceniae]BBY58613.1 TetR family transcriptional regulator [Mycolicibacterium sarraceniae]